MDTLLLDSEQNYISRQVKTQQAPSAEMVKTQAPSAETSKTELTVSSVKFVNERTQSYLGEDFLCRRNDLDIFFRR